MESFDPAVVSDRIPGFRGASLLINYIISDQVSAIIISIYYYLYCNPYREQLPANHFTARQINAASTIAICNIAFCGNMEQVSRHG